MQIWHMSCACLENDSFLGTPSSYDHVFTPRAMRQREDLKAQKVAEQV